MICEFEKKNFSANIIPQMDEVLIVRGCLSCLFYIVVVIRYTRPDVFCKKGVLGSFPVSFAKFLRAPFVIEHLPWLLLLSSTKLNSLKI